MAEEWKSPFKESNDLPSKVQHSWLLYGSQVLYTTHGLELSTVVFFFLYMRREVHKKYLSRCQNHKTLRGNKYENL